MKAAVREYTAKVVVLTISMADAETIVRLGVSGALHLKLQQAVENALEADRASDAKEDEDVPF